MSAASHRLRTSYNMIHDEDLKVKVIDEHTAVILDKDRDRLRLTPAGQKCVAELVFPGDIIRTNYGREGQRHRIIGVRRFLVYGLPTFSLTLVDEDVKPNRYGEYREDNCGWINDCVAQDGRILRLFEANDDEVFVVERGPSSNLQRLITGELVLKTKPHPPEPRKAIIEVNDWSEKDWQGKIRKNPTPLFNVSFHCSGCGCSCGGGHCVDDKSKINEALNNYRKHLLSCKIVKEKHRYLIIKVKDFRTSKNRQNRLQIHSKKSKTFLEVPA